MNKNIAVGLLAVIAVVLCGYFAVKSSKQQIAAVLPENKEVIESKESNKISLPVVTQVKTSITDDQAQIIYSQLQQQFPLDENSHVFQDSNLKSTFYIAVNANQVSMNGEIKNTVASIRAYDATLDLQWVKTQKVSVNEADVLFKYSEPDLYLHELLVPLKQENGMLIFGKIADDWSPNNCQSTFLAFKKYLYSINTESKGIATAKSYTPTEEELNAEQIKQDACNAND